jgi:hypothetical protein
VIRKLIRRNPCCVCEHGAKVFDGAVCGIKEVRTWPGCTQDGREPSFKLDRAKLGAQQKKIGGDSGTGR